MVGRQEGGKGKKREDGRQHPDQDTSSKSDWWLKEEDQDSCWYLDQLDITRHACRISRTLNIWHSETLGFPEKQFASLSALSRKQESTQPWHHETVNTGVYISVCMCEWLSSLPKQMWKMLKRLWAQLLADKLRCFSQTHHCFYCFIPLSVLIWIRVYCVVLSETILVWYSNVWLHGHHYLTCSYMFMLAHTPPQPHAQGQIQEVQVLAQTSSKLFLPGKPTIPW